MIDLQLNAIDQFNNWKELKSRWTELVDSLMRLTGVSSALITKVVPPYIKVFCSSENKSNPYQQGDKLDLKYSYTEQVIREDKKLLVTNANKSEGWVENAAKKYGMISYLGFPLKLPSGDIFGTICLLDDKENNFDKIYEETLFEFKGLVEADLARIYLEQEELESSEIEDDYKNLFNETEQQEGKALITRGDYEILLNNIPDLVWYLVDEKTYGAVNEAYAEFVGEKKEEIKGNSIYDIIADNDYIESCIEDNKEIFQTGEKLKTERWGRNAQGEKKLLSILKIPKFNKNGEIKHIVCVGRDITEQKRVEKERQYRLAAMNASMDGMAILNQNREFTYLNEAHLEIYGYDSREELIGENWRILYDQKEIQRLEQEVLPEFESKGRWRGEATGKKKDGSKFPQEVSITEIEAGGLICVVRDITNRKEAEKKIRRLSFHDEVTDLYNRFYFEEELKRLDTKRQLPLSLIVGDMNGLKLVNDAFGHTRGDRRLKQMADVLKSCCREEDIIARWGGDEFAIILTQAGQTVADGVCKRIERACKKSGDGEIALSIALGTATKTDKEQDIKEVFDQAEDRMYRKKLVESPQAKRDMISSLEQSLLRKNYEAEEHAERLENLAVKFGQKLGLSSSTLDKLALLASLHDIGKVAIDDKIINKKCELSQEEWMEIKKHPEIGYRIAQASDDLTPIAEAILAHHEWWDGTGYPRGLQGKEIPLIARVIAIIDAYDVMTHGRPYKEAVSHEEAIEELREYSGIQFDPYLTDKFIELLTYEKDTTADIN